MQPYFFPYVGYFSLFEAADIFVIYDDVNYIKKGWVNRNYFFSQSGPQRFTLPISKASQNIKICSLKLQSLEKSKLALFKTLCHAYARAPYYKTVMAMLEGIFECETVALTDFLVNALTCINKYLGITVDIICSSKMQLGVGLAGQDRIIDIAKALNAKNYINSIGGMELYSGSCFQTQGLVLQFLKHKGSNYRQFSGVHIPYLSIIDVLMFNSPGEAMKIVKNYELING
ncbi:WbqC family protein [Aliiglaciecola sp. 2_MG-2023]|uniref:WbqC family protein n=1 Tax=unclassified Aliiglaciecola TaxID=2593648 RepID=UPI0026E17F7D|nr:MULTISPECIES: WbqC family protein [unclassified Aliiglaciecola]MDO6709118.1 WbqC family protein [Aliiglaciecola sp. 2_MG-2023]MDO6750266.1 WbqC family protein [Aliiglaciecola sp. 1_MG-2023]